MKVFITPILTTLAVAQLLTVGCSKHDQTPSVGQNKPEAALVRDVQIAGAPHEPNPGLDALLSKGPQAMPDLARLLQSGASRAERIKAADAMGAIAYHNPNAPEVQDTVPVLTVVAQKGDSEFRFRAVQALGAIGRGASSAAPVLIQLTRDANSSVRMCAVEALGRIGAASVESVSALTAAMSDTSSDVRTTATNALEISQKGHK
jgi:HEAT repeat protein